MSKKRVEYLTSVQYFEGLVWSDTTAATCICNVTLGSNVSHKGCSWRPFASQGSYWVLELSSKGVVCLGALGELASTGLKDWCSCTHDFKSKSYWYIGICIHGFWGLVHLYPWFQILLIHRNLHPQVQRREYCTKISWNLHPLSWILYDTPELSRGLLSGLTFSICLPLEQLLTRHLW